MQTKLCMVSLSSASVQSIHNIATFIWWNKHTNKINILAAKLLILENFYIRILLYLFGQTFLYDFFASGTADIKV